MTVVVAVPKAKDQEFLKPTRSRRTAFMIQRRLAGRAWVRWFSDGEASLYALIIKGRHVSGAYEGDAGGRVADDFVPAHECR